MNNVLAGTSNVPANDLYPDQNLTTQSLHADYGYTSCDACNLIPQPVWTYGACASCEELHAPRHYYAGADVGDARMTGTQGYVPIPGQYVPAPLLRAVATCDLRTIAQKRGVSWQNYNLSSTCASVRG
jgi:hypothetical protein